MYNDLKKSHPRSPSPNTYFEWYHNNHSVPGAGVATSTHWVRGVNPKGIASPSLRKDQEWCHRLRRAGLRLRGTRTRMRNLLMSPGPQNVTLRYIYTFASHLNVYSWSSSHLYSNVWPMYMGQISINRMTTKLTPCVSCYYTETRYITF